MYKLMKYGSFCDSVLTSVRHFINFRKMTVVFVVSLLCVFGFILSTVFFGVLYYKISESTALPDWPKPSNSLLGEYTGNYNNHSLRIFQFRVCGGSRQHILFRNWKVQLKVEIQTRFCRNTLLDGGNAVEAAVATLFCIGVLDGSLQFLTRKHFMFSAISRTWRRPHDDYL
jgi:hypothetical protein